MAATLALVFGGITSGKAIRVVVGVQVAEHLRDHFGFIVLEIDDAGFSFLQRVLVVDFMTQRIAVI
jgi:hypothetical protein